MRGGVSYWWTNLDLMSEATSKDWKFMRWAMAGAELFATCSKAKYMAIIVDEHGHVLSSGYNGGPSGMEHCEDGGCPRARNGVPAGTPYDYGPGLCIAVHAEANALLHSDYSAGRMTLYINGAPCFGCAKLIANSGVRRVVYLEDAARTDFSQAVAFLVEAGIDCVEIEQISSIVTDQPTIDLSPETFDVHVEIS